MARLSAQRLMTPLLIPAEAGGWCHPFSGAVLTAQSIGLELQ
jgi:hypothetical protein